MKNYLLALAALLFWSCGVDLPPFDGEVAEAIQLNQLGYFPTAHKSFSLTLPSTDNYFYLVDSELQIVFTGELGAAMDWQDLAGIQPIQGDFSAYQSTANKLRVYVPGVGYSHDFAVLPDPLLQAAQGSMKGLYYHRASQALPERYAGPWHRAAGHADTALLMHPSSGHQSGSWSAPGGWYDAGDYNKYVLNAAFPAGQLMALYEGTADLAADGQLNIPESSNGQSDYLDELKYELDWLLHMQDRDGGCFHKLTTLSFEPMVMPHEATSQRYIVGKGTGATLNFAAAMAQAARVYQEYDSEFAANCLIAAQRAWEWAVDRPAEVYTNPADVRTGQYGDTNFDDERLWAAAELWLSTEEEQYLRAVENEIGAEGEAFDFQFASGNGWNRFMGHLAIFSLLRFEERLPEALRSGLQAGLLAEADSLVAVAATNAYYQPITQFEWGSNSDVANVGMIWSIAYQQIAKPEYLHAARRAADYLLGHNPLGVSYLTGFGDKTPLFIHQRQSAADGIAAPVPGLIAGGPNARRQDAAEATYPENVPPMQSWVDQEPSYASNEVCLNWNASLTYLLGWLSLTDAQ